MRILIPKIFSTSGITSSIEEVIASGGTSLNGIATCAVLSCSRPAADSVDGSWLPSTGNDLYACIDELDINDDDYIYVTSVDSFCTVALQSIALGGTGTYTISYRAKGDGNTDLTVTLLCGAVQVGQWVETAISNSITTYSHNLTAGEVEKLTDGTSLYLKFES